MQFNHSSINLSKHAVKRTQQRGIKPQIVDLITSEADIEFPANDNCFSISISRKKLFYLKKLGKINSAIIDEADGVTLIEDNEGTIITAFHKQKRFRLRKYSKKLN